jgi:hypothetical protein
MVEGQTEGLNGRGDKWQRRISTRGRSTRAAGSCERAVQVSGGLDHARAAVLVHVSAFG